MKTDEVPFRSTGHRDASASATAAFALLPYPISKDEMMAAVGDWMVPYRGRKLALAELLMNAPTDSFESPADAIKAFDQHWGRIASALPDDEDE